MLLINLGNFETKQLRLPSIFTHPGVIVKPQTRFIFRSSLFFFIFFLEFNFKITHLSKSEKNVNDINKMVLKEK